MSISEIFSPQAVSSVHTSDYWLLLVTSILVFFDTRISFLVFFFFFFIKVDTNGNMLGKGL